MTGNCGSKFQNKNLWGGITLTRTSQGVVFELKEDGTMTINGTATGSMAYSYDGGRVASNNIYITLPAGTYNYRIDNPNNDLQYQLYELPKDSTTLTILSSSTSKTITIEEAKQIGVRINVPAGVTLNNYTAKIIIEKSSTFSSYEAHVEQNAPLSLGNIEAYEGDEIQIDYVQKAGYKKVTGARLVQNVKKYVYNNDLTQNAITENVVSLITPELDIAPNMSQSELASISFCNMLTSTQINYCGLNGTTSAKKIRIAISTRYATSLAEAKQLCEENNLTIIYKALTPVITPITDPTLLAQLETLINMKTYKEVTNIDLTGEDLAPVLDCDYYQDMSTLNDRLDELEARIELLEE